MPFAAPISRLVTNGFVIAFDPSSPSGDSLSFFAPSGARIAYFDTGGLLHLNSHLDLQNQTGDVAVYRDQFTAGMGVPAVYARAFLTAQAATVASVTSKTPGGADFQVTNDATYLIVCYVRVSAFTSGSLNVQVTFTDEASNVVTFTLALLNTAGAVVTALNAAGDFIGLPVLIHSKANTVVTVKTAGAFVLTYDIDAAIIEVN